MIHIAPKMDASHFVSERQFRAATTKANAAMALEFHAKMLPDRFKKDKQAKFGNKPRGTRYAKWKRRKWESRRPLKNGQYVEGSGVTDNVLTGDMRDNVTRVGTIRAFPTRATLTMDGPRYMTMRTMGSQPDKLKEIFSVTADEHKRLAEVADAVIERAAAS